MRSASESPSGLATILGLPLSAPPSCGGAAAGAAGAGAGAAGAGAGGAAGCSLEQARRPTVENNAAATRALFIRRSIGNPPFGRNLCHPRDGLRVERLGVQEEAGRV